MTGFVVVDGRGNVYKLGEDRMLWIPTYRGTSSLFADRATANKAIARTNSYAKRHRYVWAQDMRVMRVSNGVKDFR